MRDSATLEISPYHAVSAHITTIRSRIQSYLWLGGIAASAALGLSAPGFDQWYLAWFGLVPFFLLIFTARNPWVAGCRGFAFWSAYNLVYMHWYLLIRPACWTESYAMHPILMSATAWVMISMHQGLLAGIFSSIVRCIPWCFSFVPMRHGNRWLAPALIMVPPLWVIVMDKIGNAPALLGVPWSLIEYSQYKQVLLLQCASVVGGSGISAAIVLANLLLLGLICRRHPSLPAYAIAPRASFLVTLVVTTLILLMIPGFGAWRLASNRSLKTATVSALQANLTHNINGASAPEIITRYFELSTRCPAGLCVWPEWSMVVDRTNNAYMLRYFAGIARERKQNWILGTIDTGGIGKMFNTVSAIARDGTLLDEIYHKRYLVPFGEYTPSWVLHSALRTILLKAGKFEETEAGHKITIFRFKDLRVAPIVCFENILPALVAENVRAGAEIIVDCSNTSWFYRSILGDQMLAFCAMRAAETHRSFVFATALGPSAIIDPHGRILRQSPRETSTAITAAVPIEHDLTPFTRWCF